MKNKNLIIGLAIAVVVIGIILIARPFVSKKPVKKAIKVTPLTKAGKKPTPAPTKKAISKDKGGLTVKIMNSKKREMPLKIRAFKSIDARSSIYVAAFTSNRMQELSPGTYDIEIDTIPQKIYKNVRVIKGGERIEDLGSITGAINVKALNAQKKDASYAVRVLYPKSNDVATTATANRPIEIMPGVYDIEVGTTPRQLKRDVKIESGKENILDLGCMAGTLLVKALDENGKEARYSTRVTKSENNEFVAAAITNRPIEILPGIYNIEVSSAPKQDKKEVKVNAGEETSIEFTVQAPPAPKAPAPSPKTTKR